MSRENTWSILNFVRSSGPAGAAADEISKELTLPPSLVYSTLKELRRLEFVSLVPRTRGRAKERKRRYMCERMTWGKYRVESSFMDALLFEGITDRLTERMKGPILEAFTELFEEFDSKRRLKTFLPPTGDDSICGICGRNHQALEFVYAIILAALDPYINESDEFRNFLARRGYASGLPRT